jgi:hypothetical protein
MKNLLIATFIITTAQIAQASTVNWGAQTDTVLLSTSLNNTTTLPVGSIIRLGYFNLSDVAIQAFHAAADLASLDANFVQYDFATSGEGVEGLAGAFVKGSASPANVNANQQIYLWVLQASNNSSIAQAIATASGEAIFYVDRASNSEWQFPPVFNGVANIDIGDLTNASGAAGVGAHLVVGNYRANVNRPDLQAAFGAPRVEGIQVAPVPEPTSAFLVAVGAAGLMMRRRRQS